MKKIIIWDASAKLNFFSIGQGRTFLSHFLRLNLEVFIASSLFPARGGAAYFGHHPALG